MEYKDYYRILGVARDADTKQINRAFRKLAQQYHPDRNPGDKQSEEKFKEINEAHEVLGDPAKRAKYDQLGESYRAWQRTGGQGSGFDWSQWQTAPPEGVRIEYTDLDDLLGGGFSDFFNAIFGGIRGSRQGRSAPSRGRRQRIEQPVHISLQEAYTGTTRMLHVNGRRLEVKIPPGSKSGTKVRIPAHELQDGQASGDLYLVVTVDKDPLLERKGDDLHASAVVDLYDAVLGGEIRVPTPSGALMLTVPSGSQPGQVFRLQGRGMPNLRNPKTHGDFYVQIKVRIPRTLSDEEKELFHKLAALRRK
jgi:curved DNA-binding protein